MTIIPDLCDLVIEQVRMTNEVTITVRADSPTAPCPCCGIISKRIQSRYTRTLRDLPASGRPVHLVLHVRRFFSQESSCVRKIFAERFPALTLPRVKFTLRLQEALREMGFELGGEGVHAWSNEPNCLLPRPYVWWGWMIGHGNAACAMELPPPH
jgi:transposase